MLGGLFHHREAGHQRSFITPIVSFAGNRARETHFSRRQPIRKSVFGRKFDQGFRPGPHFRVLAPEVTQHDRVQVNKRKTEREGEAAPPYRVPRAFAVSPAPDARLYAVPTRDGTARV